MPNFLPFLIISGLAICVITLINTNFALVILIFSMLLSPEIPIGAIPGRPVVLRIDDILVIIIFFTWLAKLALNRELGLLRRTKLNLPIGVYITISIIATLLGLIEGRLNLLTSAFYLLKYFEYFMLFFMVINNIKSRRQIKVFIFFMLLTALITCLYAMRTVKYYQRATAPFEEVGGQRGEPNTLGGYLILISGLIAGLLLYDRNFLSRASLGMLALLVVATLLSTLSRGSYLGFTVMFMALALFTKRNRVILIALICLFIFFGYSALPRKVTQRINETFVPGRVYRPFGMTRIVLDESATARVDSWRVAFERWQKSPLLGYGVTGAGFIDTQIPLILGETGIVGLAAFIWLIITIFRNSLWSLKNMGDDYFRGLALGYIAALIGLLFHAFSAATFIIVRIMEPFWFLTAIVIVLPEFKE